MDNAKNINVYIDSVEKYINLLNGLFNLTVTEIKILSHFVRIAYKHNKENVVTSPFTTEYKKQVAEKLGRDDFNTLNTYIQNFKQKSAIFEDPIGYMINPVLIPQGEHKIIFTLTSNNKSK